MLRAIRYRVQNFRNIDDSGWISLERVTAFVGRNESGKTALLKALHKFNPATPDPYNPQREFPRDRYTKDCKNPSDWPVCSVAFEIDATLRSELQIILGDLPVPREVVCTRYYDSKLEIVFDPGLPKQVVSPDAALDGLKAFASGARRLAAPSPEQEAESTALRGRIATWASDWQDKLTGQANLYGAEGASLLATLRAEAEAHSSPSTATLVEALLATIDPVRTAAQQPPVIRGAEALVKKRLPVFIYFENYGILDSAIYLPRLLEDLGRAPNDPRIRTINAMFKHVGLTAQEIAELGRESAQQARNQGQQVTDSMITQDQEKKEARAIKLNSASLDITKRFNDWYLQRRHSIDYHADGDYFRIWVADDRRTGVKIELEGRSKGFQWFFSFYLVFLVESEEGHKDAILLLDEPGMHLHPTAQQGLITFLEKLSEKNQLIYTTHSPFLIDGEHLHRVRPVTEDRTGHSTISDAETWPSDRETIFPLQAAAGYAMVRGLFQNKKNVLVEGMSDYYYLHALASQCHASKRDSLPDDVYVTPCGGTKLVGQIASLFLGQEVRPVVLLDGDDAGRTRRDALIKELYAGHLPAVLMLDEALGRAGSECEVEDILGEAIILPGVNGALGSTLALSAADRKAGSIVSQVESCATRRKVELPKGWKAMTALHLVSSWAENKTKLPDEVLDRAAMLFSELSKRFE